MLTVDNPMQALIQSFFLVAASEMGDKTQLLALVLALRYKRPWPIMAGIFVATLLNHGFASYAGDWIGRQVSGQSLHYILAAIFFGFAAWMLVPDKLEEDKSAKPSKHHHPFLATVVLFFLAEMGDKTQLATIALGAKFQDPIMVTTGTTLGMLLADGLAVFFGEALTRRLSMKYVRLFAAVSFFAFGLLVLFAN